MFKHGHNDGHATVPRSERRGRRCLRTRFTMAVVAVVAAMAGALVLPAGSASATSAALIPSTFVVVHQSRLIPRDVDPGEFIQANCPAGTKAVAAGVISSGLKALSIRDTPVEMAVVDSGAGSGADQFVVAQATCAPSAQLADAHVITGTLRNHTSNPASTLTTNCPAGEIAIGGGALVLNPDGFRNPNASVTTLANAPANGGRGWTVTVKDFTNNKFDPDQIAAKVRCIPGPRPGEKTTVLKETVFPMTPRPGSGVAQAQGYSICPSGTLPITGGAVITGSSSDGAIGLNTTELVQDVGGWFANGWAQVTAGIPAALHVIVRCG
jgi:hypothetical protein